MNNDHNQKLGFGRFGKKAYGREEQHKTRDLSSRSEIKEVRIAEAKSQLLTTGEINRILKVIGGGKEATVLLAEKNDKELVCAKVFKFFTSTIKKRLRSTKHITADDMATLAARQEYWNLKEMQRYVPVPKPYNLIENIVIMEFIGKSDSSITPAPLLKEVDLTQYDPEEILHESIDILAQLFIEGKFIHGDYSEYNLMVTQKGSLFTMDVSQSVQYNTKTFIDTPVRIRVDKALKLLETDIRNINQYFKRIYRININPNEIVEEIFKELPQKLQNFLNEKTMEIYPSSLYSSEIYVSKERYRYQIVLQRTGSARQRPK